MDRIFEFCREKSAVLLRVSLGLVLLWIGALKFAHPEGVVDLLKASFPFLATTAVVYALGVAEVGSAVLLFANRGVRWVGLVLVGLFAGTLTIFVIAPAVSYGTAGFPHLSFAGEFLLKDTVLMAASVAVVGLETARRQRTSNPMPTEGRRSPMREAAMSAR